MNTKPFAILVPLLAAGCLMAEDVKVSDIRLEFGIMPNNFEASSSTRVTSSSGTVTNSSSSNDKQNADSNWRGAVQLMFGNLASSGGFVYGGEVAVNYAKFSNGGTKTTQTSPVADIMLGYGFAPTKEWHFEVTPFAGIGVSYGDVSGDNQVDANYDAVYTEYGLRAATYYTFESHWQVGLDLRYIAAQSNPEFDYTTTGNNSVHQEQDQSNHGFSGLIGVGRRF